MRTFSGRHLIADDVKTMPLQRHDDVGRKRVFNRHLDVKWHKENVYMGQIGTYFQRHVQ